MDAPLIPPAPGDPSADAEERVPGRDGAACPWCSVALGDPLQDRCPSCGARISEPDPDASIPGVTEVDLEAARAAAAVARRIERAARRPFGWNGELQSLPPDRVPAPSPGALAPPSEEVRREMARLRADQPGPADESTPTDESTHADQSGDPG